MGPFSKATPAHYFPPLYAAVAGFAFAAVLCATLVIPMSMSELPSPSGMRLPDLGAVRSAGIQNASVGLGSEAPSAPLGFALDDQSLSAYHNLTFFWRSDVDVADVGQIVFSRETTPPGDRGPASPPLTARSAMSATPSP